MMKSRIAFLVAMAGPLILPHAAAAHPHMIADAELRVQLAPDGRSIAALHHTWRFDDVSSSMFLVDLDANGDLTLDETELIEAGKIMLDSMAMYNYFQLVTIDGKDTPMNPPKAIGVTYENNLLSVDFEASPKEPLRLAGKVDIGVYDPTFYVALDFLDDEQLQVENLPPACRKTVIRPDPDEAIAQNQQSLTDAFMNDPAGNDMGKIFATRLELNCQTNG